MVRARIALLALICLLGQLLTALPAVAAAPAADEGARVIVGLARGVPAAEAAQLHANAKAQVIKEIPTLGLHVVQGPKGVSAADLAQAYARNPRVRFAEPDARVAPDLIPNDPQYGSQWHHGTMGNPPAWDYSTGAGVMIAICDTGVDASHPDLAQNVRGDLGVNIVDGTANWADEHGHGTMVAGTAAAVAGNAIGVAGVAYGAQIIPVRITNQPDFTAYVSDGAACIEYAAANGARAINLSYRMAGYAAIDTAAQHAESLGAVVTLSGGNDGINPGYYPYESFLAVAATDSTDQVASFSSYGRHVDLAAPGVNIYTTKKGATYGLATGTSFAAPAVAGVAALLFAADPAMTPARVKQLLQETASDRGTPGRDDYYGFGRVDSRRAVGRVVNQIDGTIRVAGSDFYTTDQNIFIYSSVVDDSGTGVTEMRFSEDEVTWTAWEPFTSLKSFTLSPGDGPKPLSAQFKNGAGSISVPARTMTLLDTTPPTGSVSINGGAAFTGSNALTLQVTGTDAVSGVTQMRFSDDGVTWGAWEPYATTRAYTAPAGDGLKTVYAQFMDFAGFISAPVTDTITVETVAPTGSIVIAGGAEYARSQGVTLSLTATDDQSGVTQMRFSRDGLSWGGWHTFAPTHSWSLYTQGVETVHVQFQDAAGNISAAASDSIVYDSWYASTYSIVINDGAEFTTVPQVTLTLTAVDDVSGVVEMRLNPEYYNSATWLPWEPYAPTREFTLTAEGSRTVMVEYRDRAGNVTPVRYDSITYDKTPPNGSVMINNGNPAYVKTPDVSLYLTGSSEAVSYRLANDGVTWTDWRPWDYYAIPWTLTPEDGPKTVYVEMVDRAGNVGQYTDTVILDTTGPTVTGSSPGNGSEVTVLRTITITMADAGSGVDEYWTCPVDVTKNGVALQYSTCTYTVADQVTVTLPAGDNGEGQYAFTITPEDALRNLGAPVTINVIGLSAAGAAPGQLTATVSGTSVTLSWTDNSTFETAFVVERAVKLKTGTGAYTVVGNVTAPDPAGRFTTVSFTDPGLAVNTYVYRVKAVGPTQSSGYSSTVQARIR